MTSTMERAAGVAALEQAFGDPWDDTNPTGFAELLASDERQEMSPAGEALLDDYRLNAEFVPAEYGGRFTGMDRFTRVMRAVWRHDACLGLGYGFASFIAGANVWGAGSAEQRTRLADMLLAGRKVSSVYHELAHGNDFSHAEFAATPLGDGWVLNGRKEVVSNLERSHAMVMFVRTDQRPGSRSHSQFLVCKDDIPAGAIRYLPRFRSSGMRGVQLGGAEFVDCPVGPDALIGGAGRGIETALSSFQLTRTGLPALAAGCLDTGLRTALHCATERRLYGAGVIALPYVRTVLADAFTDLLIVDAFSTTVARALHLRPAETGVFASAVKGLGSRMLIDAMDELGGVLGARGYVRDGRYGIFQKMARDLPTAGFGHASRAACRVTVLPQLPRLARSAWLRGEPADGLLFRLGADLPPLPFDRLVAGGPGTDGLVATLADLAERPLGGHLDRLVAPLLAEVGQLRDACGALRPSDLTIDASPAAAALVDRYAAVLAAASCLGVWWHNRHDPFVGDDVWVTAALHRLTERLGLPPVLSEAQVVATQEALLREALARLADRRAFDLTHHTLPG